jgi:spore germination protein
VYTVQEGDTLLGIALEYGVNPDDIAALNALPDVNVLSIGQKLVLSLTPLAAPQPAAPPVARSSQANAQAKAPAGLPVHVVREGDTLIAIGAQYHVSVEELVRLNRLPDPDSLSLGQVLILSAIPESVYQSGNTDRPPRPAALVWLVAGPPEDHDFVSFIHIPQGS